ncbi:MAG: hypothetical protein FJX80_05780 [Bacteroidetes bacterium]|nr:hypothetical protein [Bacteroidota bacterium]
MIQKYLAIILLFLSFRGEAQMVKFIKNPVTAQYRVYVANKPEGATHWIYRVSGPSDIRKPGDWYIVPNPQLFKNAVTLYEVKNREEADWVVYYVSRRDSARIRIK